MMSDSKEEGQGEDPPPPPSVHSSFFEFMIQRRSIFMFLVTLPILWIVFIAVGWSKDDRVEDSVYNIWTRQRSSYKEDIDYASDYDRDRLGATSFAALAASRDGENLFTPDRLKQVMDRMEETEATTVSASSPLHDN